MQHPWTEEELRALIPRVEAKLAETEQEYPHAHPLLPMTAREALEYLSGLMELASRRALIEEERFLHGQLLSVYKMAIQAEMLGKKGSYFVLSKEQIEEMIRRTN